MGISDWQTGYALAEADSRGASNQLLARLEHVADEWVAEAKAHAATRRKFAETAAKLADVTAYNISNDAKAAGRGAVIDALVTELAKLDPSNPLLDKKVRNKINDAAQAPVFERAGWRLLPEGGLEKI